MKEKNNYFNIKEAAEYMGINTKLMSKMTHLDGFPCMRSKRVVIIQREALDKWFVDNSNRFIK